KFPVGVVVIDRRVDDELHLRPAGQCQAVMFEGHAALDGVVDALAVVYPAAGNIGGGGFMTIRLKDGTKTFLDFRERAP
ncbi:gamma-glutamyltransferase, partial [Rhizobium leguminosarum]|uniref:gamma-glutamyltransferase n=1 Tax=Rhizobium leguminosarum TaxID=384 RepID=UPI003F9BFD56